MISRSSIHVEFQQSMAALEATRISTEQCRHEHCASPPAFPAEALGKGFSDYGHALRTALEQVYQANLDRLDLSDTTVYAAQRDLQQIGGTDRQIAEDMSISE
ncbi:hypothetical protein GP475_02660 [Corynebacterium poyangense]|uniref:Uncharacterized protein n=1 Tax=Corynebacterium poyangense TaxID=2684405 RepID=A0A7H0SM88_9CORY|nr:hypothetical protein [Corynebacterium poyangense]MBZ8176763.1 hypothetical protein [Corynebacterium poyangense]QNQ89663.1 hypothetical protein GP475_02660 [Corynebacterium poyangense]